MDAVHDFFRRYNAVPATDAGPQWETATTDALLDWLTGEFYLIRRGAGDPKRTMLKGALAETWARIGRLTKEAAMQPRDWPHRNDVGRMLAALATNADLLTVSLA